MWSPHGIPGFPSRLYKIKKALYGLKQAHFAWHRRFCKDLHTLGFVELKSTLCVFRKKSGAVSSFILVYVDDLLILSETSEELQVIMQSLKSLYELRGSDDVEWFLGARMKWYMDDAGRVTAIPCRIRCQTLSGKGLRPLKTEGLSMPNFMSK